MEACIGAVFSWKEGKMLQPMTRAYEGMSQTSDMGCSKPRRGNPRVAGSWRRGGDKIPTSPVNGEVLNRESLQDVGKTSGREHS